jgi:hypothetical protein
MVDEAEKDWNALCRKLFRRLPDDYSSAKIMAQEISHAFHEELAKAIAPSLKTKLETMPRSSYAERKETASWCNHELHELRLCIRCPRTGRSGILVADLGGHAGQYSRFRLSVRDSEGRSHRTWTSSDLPEPFDLMEAAPRREGRSHWEGRPHSRE